MDFVLLNSDNFKSRSKEWSSFFYNNKRKHFTFKIKETALLIIDMQNYFLDTNSLAHFSCSQLIIENVNKIINFSNKHNLLIFYTFQKNDSLTENCMKRWWKHLPNNEQSELYCKINVSNNSHFIYKATYSAFLNTDLDIQLKNNKIKNIIICGVKTNLCCETTAREAFLKDYNVIFVADATMTNNELMHLSSLINLSYGFANVIYTDEINSIF